MVSPTFGIIRSGSAFHLCEKSLDCLVTYCFSMNMTFYFYCLLHSKFSVMKYQSHCLHLVPCYCSSISAICSIRLKFWGFLACFLFSCFGTLSFSEELIKLYGLIGCACVGDMRLSWALSVFAVFLSLCFLGNHSSSFPFA